MKGKECKRAEIKVFIMRPAAFKVDILQYSQGVERDRGEYSRIQSGYLAISTGTASGYLAVSTKHEEGHGENTRGIQSGYFETSTEDEGRYLRYS